MLPLAIFNHIFIYFICSSIATNIRNFSWSLVFHLTFTAVEFILTNSKKKWNMCDFSLQRL